MDDLKKFVSEHKRRDIFGVIVENEEQIDLLREYAYFVEDKSGLEEAKSRGIYPCSIYKTSHAFVSCFRIFYEAWASNSYPVFDCRDYNMTEIDLAEFEEFLIGG